MMMMCFISYVSSHGVKKIILLYTMMSKIFDVCSFDVIKVYLFSCFDIVQVCTLMFFNRSMNGSR